MGLIYFIRTCLKEAVMNQLVKDVHKLISILEDEANGNPFDSQLAVQLAEKIITECPTVSWSLQCIITRLGDNNQFNAA